jgi:TRAP-type C4-dicarboxylate transport system permease small subunit
MADKFILLTEKIAKLCGIFAAVCLLLSIILITELVFERYIFRNAITWQTELVTMLLVASTFIGSAYVLSEKGHVNMEYLYSFMSEKGVTKLKIFTDTLCLLFFLILFYVSF